MRKVPCGRSPLHALVQDAASADLVDALVQREPRLGVAAVVAALEAPGIEPYRRLEQRGIVRSADSDRSICTLHAALIALWELQRG